MISAGSSLGPSDGQLMMSVRICESWSDRGVFWKGGLFKDVHLLEILEYSEMLKILERPQSVKNKGESDHPPDILENFEML